MKTLSLDPAITTQRAPQCRQLLPSAQTALDLQNRRPGSWMLVLRDTAIRAIPIGVGLYVAGERESVVKKALAGSAAIETAVLFLASLNNR